MFKVIVAGSRNFANYELMKEKLSKILFAKYSPQQIEIVSGTARGADELGERFAEEFGCSVQRFSANWNLYGKSAGYRRNANMAKYADALVLFWDGVSKGSGHMLDLAKKHRLQIRVVYF